MRKEYTLLQGEADALSLAGAGSVEAVALWGYIGKKLGFEPATVALNEAVPLAFTAEEVVPTFDAPAGVTVSGDNVMEIDLGDLKEAAGIQAFSDLIMAQVHFAVASDALSVPGALSGLTSAFTTMLIKTSPPENLTENAGELLGVVRKAIERHASGKCSCGGDHGAGHHDA